MIAYKNSSGMSVVQVINKVHLHAQVETSFGIMHVIDVYCWGCLKAEPHHT